MDIGQRGYMPEVLQNSENKRQVITLTLKICEWQGTFKQLRRNCAERISYILELTLKSD